jgi:dTDP-4-dehydrorhamnose 3,5-epimerase
MTNAAVASRSIDGLLEGATKDGQSITAEWMRLQDLIDGVQVREVRNVCKPGGGVLTEVFRCDWNLDRLGVDQVFQNLFEAGGISGWHVHLRTTDRIFVNLGLLKIVLYDARTKSPTAGRINEFCFGSARPALVIIPPGVWHAVQNLHDGQSALLNLVDAAYEYEDPDHWRLPIDTDQIPYRFTKRKPELVDANH